jgi:ElaB/YqjD/DUF883 family membrane-anchored ribosome-binding protein
MSAMSAFVQLGTTDAAGKHTAQTLPRRGEPTKSTRKSKETFRMKGTTKATLDSETPIDLAAVVDDLAALRHDFSALMNQMKSGSFSNGNDAAENAVRQLGDRANRLYDVVAARGERSARALGRQIEEQPIMSLLIAFGVGFVASRLLVR